MRRKTFDVLLSTVGLIMAAVLLVAGGLLTWASTFIGDQVHEQLTDQRITMPSGDSIAEPQYAPLREYAGEQMSTGDHAYAFAEYYIKNHMGDRTYNELGGDIREAEAAGDEELAAELTAERESRFKGETLRGILLYGYAFATMGKIAGFAAIAAYVGAAIMAILAGLGLWHSRKVGDEVVVG